MTRRRLLLLVGLVAVVALAGCSTDGGSTTTAPETADSPVTTLQTPTDAEAGPDESTATTTADSSSREQTTTRERAPADISASGLTSDVAQATESIEDYTATLNLTVETFGNNLVQTSTSNQTLALDREATVFRRTNAQRTRGQTVTAESYLVEETVYTKSPTNARAYSSEWTKFDVSDNTTEAFDQWDELENTRKYLDNASLSSVGRTTLDGSDAYVFDAEIDGSAYADINGLGNQTTVDNVSATYFVDTQSDRVERVDVDLYWTLTLRGQSYDQHVVGTYTFDYADVSVSLPDAASSAVAIGNESDSENETDDGDSTDGSGDTDATDDTDDSEMSTGSGIAVQNGNLSVDPDDAFHRVERALDTNVSDPDAVRILDPLNASDRGNESAGEDRLTFAQRVGLESESLVGQNISVGDREYPYGWVAEVRVTGVGRVFLRSAPGMPTDFQRTLATHEFVHYVQLQNGRFTQVNTATDATTDGTYARRATLEGAAVYTTDTIHAEDDRSGPPNSALYEGVAAATAGSTTAYGNSWYRFGARYAAQRVDSPADLSALYENPPTTSEQVLHGLRPSAEPPAALSITDQTGSEYVLADAGRKGEAFTRFVMENGVSEQRAAAAAAGWGNDTLRTVRPSDGGNTSYVWVHRWDDAENATEFADAARAYLDAYGSTENGTTTLGGLPADLRTLDDRTTAIVLADSVLQDSLTLSADGSVVTVAVE